MQSKLVRTKMRVAVLPWNRRIVVVIKLVVLGDSSLLLSPRGLGLGDSDEPFGERGEGGPGRYHT